MDWADLIVAEPRLLGVEERLRLEVDRWNPDEPFCANACWYGYDDRWQAREAMAALVGWSRTQPDALRSMDAYDVAYDHLYESLPDCEDGCACGVLSLALGLG